MNFEQALQIVLKHEGGFVDHPADPGGRTNFGITERVARAAGYQGDMRHIPMDVVRRIYRRDYWDAVRADELPSALRLPVFDAAVNSGVRRSIQWLQMAVGATSDGIFGPRTLAATQAADARRAAFDVCFIRLEFLSGLQHFNSFGRGWIRRVVDILRRVQ